MVRLWRHTKLSYNFALLCTYNTFFLHDISMIASCFTTMLACMDAQHCHLWQCNMCGEDALLHIHSGVGVIIVNSIKLPAGQNWISRTGSFVYVGYHYILKWALCCWLSLVIALVMLWNLQDGIIQLWLCFFKVVATSEWVWSMSAHWCSYRTWAHQEGDHCNVISQCSIQKKVWGVEGGSI